MLRVLTLATLFPDASRPTFGGFVERQTRELAKRADVAIEVVAPIGVAPWPLGRHRRYRRFDEVPDHELWNGLIVHRPRFRVLPGTGGRLSAAAMARAVLPLLRDIQARFPFDVIDAEYFYPDGPAAMRLAAALDLPFSVKARGSDIHLWGERRGCRRQIQAAGRAADGLLAVSEALKHDMIALGMAGEAITVHHTGIDRDLFKPVDRAVAKAELGIAGPLIVAVGALIPRKQHALVIDAVAAIGEATLLIAGEGPERRALEAQIARLGLGGRVRLLGNRPHAEVAHLMAGADVMVLASDSEGLANVWVEALASGTPVVAGDVGGAGEVIDQPAAGALVPLEPAAIAGAIRALLADPPDQAAVRATVDGFSWARNSETLFAHLARLAQRQ